MMQRKDFSVRAGRRSLGVYAAALVAVGLSAGLWGNSVVLGADDGQAVQPVDVNGGTSTAPEARWCRGKLYPSRSWCKRPVVTAPATLFHAPAVTPPAALEGDYTPSTTIQAADGADSTRLPPRAGGDDPAGSRNPGCSCSAGSDGSGGECAADSGCARGGNSGDAGESEWDNCDAAESSGTCLLVRQW